MRRAVLLSFLVMGLLLGASLSYADKSAIRIEAPEKAAKGSEITVKLHVSHHGNNLMHYTKWVKVEVNGQQVEKWEFSATKRPESETFTKSFSTKVDGPLDIVAEASCNLHGSQGAANWKVAVAEEEGSEP